MKEIWKDITRYKGIYQVSNKGNIKSLIGWNGHFYINREKIMKLKVLQDGYVRVGFKNKSKNIVVNNLVHRLVAKMFIINTLNKPQVNHINGIKTDNRMENLEWCTDLENKAHAKKLGLSKNDGINNPSAKLTEKNVLFIKRNKNIYTVKYLANLFGVSSQNIYLILKNKRWKHIQLEGEN